MKSPAIRMHNNPVQARWPSFEIDGKVTEILRGFGLAVINAGGIDEFTLNRGTDGVHFEALRIGQKVSCQVAAQGHRVLHAHQQTQPVHVWPESGQAAFGTMTKDEFVAQYCRRWGVKWTDISQYRVVVPHRDGIGWAMESVDLHVDAQTSHGALEPLHD